jgi:hypothetical protein
MQRGSTFDLMADEDGSSSVGSQAGAALIQSKSAPALFSSLIGMR